MLERAKERSPSVGRALAVKPLLFLLVAYVIDADDVVACVADWFIARGVGLSQNADLPEEAFALCNSSDGFSLWI